jgi:uncharacterized protein (TIGR02594 family)
MPRSPAPWLDVARRYLGQAEVAGSRHNDTIVGFFRRVVGRAYPDETPWCAAFVGSCLMEAGLPSTGALNARSYLNYGRPLDEPCVGCIVVFARGRSSWQGHVGFVARIEGASLLVLGGNQGNSVSVVRFRASTALGFRWPDPATSPAAARPRVDVAHMQERLHAHGYREAGAIDGIFGSRTRAALLAFKADRAIKPFDQRIDDATLAALDEMPSPRPGTLERALATEDDLRKMGSETIAVGDALTTAGKIGSTAGVAAGAADVAGLFDALQTGAGEISTARNLLETWQDIGGWLLAHWYLAPLLAGIFLWRSGYRVKFLRVRDHRSGAHTGR